MQVRKIMSEGVRTIGADTTVHQAASTMRDLGVGMLPVAEMNGTVSGTVTDRDIVVRALAERLGGDTLVKEIMTPDVVRCYEDADVADAVQMMEQGRIRRILVVDRKERPVGLVSTADIARNCGHERSGEILEAVTQPS